MENGVGNEYKDELSEKDDSYTSNSDKSDSRE